VFFDLNSDKDVRLLQKATNGARIGLTSGCWDLFHYLHLVYLQRCRRLCDILLVGVDSDDFIKAVKGPERPIIPEHQRAQMVASLEIVHGTFVMGSIVEFAKAVELFNVSVIFKNRTFDEAIAGSDKADVVMLPDVKQPDSTSSIIEDIIKIRLNQEPRSATVGSAISEPSS
jgi:D-beta-D-heptose 7-phosphate kinase/D-beta-D-heptose 1-phosphate adenosyltransferase